MDLNRPFPPSKPSPPSPTHAQAQHLTPSNPKPNARATLDPLQRRHPFDPVSLPRSPSAPPPSWSRFSTLDPPGGAAPPAVLACSGCAAARGRLRPRHGRVPPFPGSCCTRRRSGDAPQRSSPTLSRPRADQGDARLGLLAGASVHAWNPRAPLRRSGLAASPTAHAARRQPGLAAFVLHAGEGGVLMLQQAQLRDQP